MSHFARALAAIILLGTGFTLSELQPLARTGEVPATASRTRTPDVVVDFYAGINQVLAGGSEDLLRESLHPRFSQRGSSQPLQSLMRELAMLRSVYPDLWLEFETLSVSEDMVDVLVTAMGSSGGNLAGSPVKFAGSGPVLDRLKILDDQIVGWQSGWPIAIRMANTLTTRWPFDMGANATLALERRTFEPEAGLDIPVNKGAVVLVESGQLELRIASSSATITVARDSASGGIGSRLDSGIQHLSLFAGDLAVIPARTPFEIRNAGELPASAIWVERRVLMSQSVARRPQFENESSDLPVGVIARTLVTAEMRPSAHEITDVAVGLAIMAPGSELSASPGTGPAVVLVSGGEILSSASESISRNADGRLVQRSGSFQYAAGEALGLPGGAHSGVYSIGSDPAVVWMFNTTSRTF